MAFGRSLSPHLNPLTLPLQMAGPRHSPPPGFLHADRVRSNSTASGRGACDTWLGLFVSVLTLFLPGMFHDINGGGEFIPERGATSAGLAMPAAATGYPLLTDVGICGAQP